MAPSLLDRIGGFAAGRYNALHGTERSLAKGYAAILIQVRNLPTSSADPDRDLLDYQSKPHTDPDVLKACKEVLEQLGTAP